MHPMKLLFFCVFCLLAGCVAGWAQAPIAELTSLTAKDTPFIDGDRLMFLGDSITQFGDGPGGYVTLFREAFATTTHPGVTVINAGISGNTVPDLQQRFASDVLAKNPSVVLIYIGINDVWHYNGDLGEPKNRYVAGLREMIGTLQQRGITVLLATPSVIGEKLNNANPLDASLDNFAATARSLAQEFHIELCDLRTAFKNYLMVHNPQNLDKGVLTADGVHLSAQGNILVAQEAAKSLLTAVRNAPYTPIIQGSDFIGSTLVAIRLHQRKEQQGLSIRYTTDGTDPTGKSSVYAKPFSVTTTTTIKARIFKRKEPVGIVTALQCTKLVPRPGEKPAHLVNGLTYHYYEGTWQALPDFTKLTALQDGTVADLELTPHKSEANFAMTFTGFIDIPADGVYTFTTNSDDGSTFFIDETPVVQNDGLHGPTTVEGHIALLAGKHPVTINFFQGGGGYLLEAYYAKDQQPLQKIPAAAWYRLAEDNK